MGAGGNQGDGGASGGEDGCRYGKAQALPGPLLGSENTAPAKRNRFAVVGVDGKPPWIAEVVARQMSMALALDAESSGALARSCASAPVTCGVAMLVPLL